MTDKQQKIGALDKAPAGSTGWRHVITPRPEVRSGDFKKAEFAANLSEVVKGSAGEYGDSIPFFERTVITKGMAGFLKQALRRLTGAGGDPAIQLKTVFGGGKTHSLLALYHLARMARDRVSLENTPNLGAFLKKEGFLTVPETNIAVIDGTAYSPADSIRPGVNTLWGEIGHQLATSAGKEEVYNLIKNSDEQSVAPGKDALIALFNACSPCLILLDELVAYGRQLKGGALPGGTFGNFLSFIQQLTEAASASEKTLVVASLPETDREAGGEQGEKALKMIEHCFGRIAAPRTPVGGADTAEITRRRLFSDCHDQDTREKVCAGFSDLYQEKHRSFPPETKESSYKERMIASYPIHPELLDRLYEDWSTLENFQRTRGVLRFMAEVIHALWEAEDESLLIMPASIPLNHGSKAREELARYIPDTWASIIDSDVDGETSAPSQLDTEKPRYGALHAARRVARTIMLGSVPAKEKKGIEESRVRLGTVQDKEDIPVFTDVLGELKNTLVYLHSEDMRVWYDTNGNLRKAAREQTKLIKKEAMDEEIEARLKKEIQEDARFKNHLCPSSPSDVPDDRYLRLVVLGVNNTYNDTKDNGALTFANELFHYRGPNIHREYCNRILFIAPDEKGLKGLREAVRSYLAWERIGKDKTRDLTDSQKKEIKEELKQGEARIFDAFKSTYRWLLAPAVDETGKATGFTAVPLSFDGLNWNELAKAAAQKMTRDETLIEKWGAALLVAELDKRFWRNNNHIKIDELWDHLCRYCYLPRLTNTRVLQEAIREGLQARQFAFAEGFDVDRYQGLTYADSAYTKSGFVVKKDAANTQLDAEKPASPVVNNDRGYSPPAAAPADDNNPQPAPPPRKTRFTMDAPLAPERRDQDFSCLMKDVIKPLGDEGGSIKKLTLFVEIDAENGFSDRVVADITANCRGLKLEGSAFSFS